MSKPKNDQKAAAITLARTGMAQRSIATKLGVSRASVQRWCAAAVADGDPLPTPRTGRRRRDRPVLPQKPGQDAAQPPEGAGDASTLAELREALQRPDGMGDEMRTIWARRMPQIRELADQAHERGDLALFRDAVRVEIDLAQRLDAATPPPPLDPAEDPRNLEARAAVREHLERLAERRRRFLVDALCASCLPKVIGEPGPTIGGATP